MARAVVLNPPRRRRRRRRRRNGRRCPSGKTRRSFRAKKCKRRRVSFCAKKRRRRRNPLYAANPKRRRGRKRRSSRYNYKPRRRRRRRNPFYTSAIGYNGAVRKTWGGVQKALPITVGVGLNAGVSRLATNLLSRLSPFFSNEYVAWLTGIGTAGVNAALVGRFVGARFAEPIQLGGQGYVVTQIVNKFFGSYLSGLSGMLSGLGSQGYSQFGDPYSAYAGGMSGMGSQGWSQFSTQHPVSQLPATGGLLGLDDYLTEGSAASASMGPQATLGDFATESQVGQARSIDRSMDGYDGPAF